MDVADPNLRNRIAAAGFLAQGGPLVGATGEINLFKMSAFPAQEILRHVAVAAVAGGIDFDFQHIPEHRPLR